MLDDTKTLIEHALGSDDRVFLNPGAVRARIKLPNGTFYELDADESYDVIHSQQALRTGEVTKTFSYGQETYQDSYGIEGVTTKQEIRLVYSDGTNVPLDISLADAAQSGKEILLNPMWVVTPSRDRVPLSVSPGTSVADAKAALSTALGGQPVSKMALHLNGVEMSNEKKLGTCQLERKRICAQVIPNAYGTVAGDFGAKSGDVLHLNPDMLPLTFKTFNGQETTVEVCKSTSVPQLKEQIAEWAKLAPSEIVLYFKGKILPGSATDQRFPARPFG